MLLLRTHLRISLQGALKNAQTCEEKDAFYAAVDDPLDSQSRGAAEGTFDGPPKDALRDFHKDEHKGAFEVALKGALGVALVLHLGLYLLMQ